MTVYKWLGVGSILLLLVAGCSSLPGLRVLSGQETPVSENRVATNVDLVMADKSGNTDPAMLVAADRLEAAMNQSVDVVEVRPDITHDTFNVFLMFQPSGNPNGSLQDQIDFENSIRLMTETTWMSMRRESERFDRFRIEWLVAGNIPTLDNGISTIAQVQAVIDIARADAIDYLSQQHDLQSFINLITDGKMSFGPPPNAEFYQGVPNHPVFMIPTPQTP